MMCLIQFFLELVGRRRLHLVTVMVVVMIVVMLVVMVVMMAMLVCDGARVVRWQ